MSCYSIIDLFCGAGGFSLGAAQAGFRPIIGIDKDSDLISSYRLNFPFATAVQTDLAQLDASGWKEILGAQRPTGIIGGPPCQGFSQMGKQSEHDLRNRLIACFFDHVLTLRPDFFVMENVEGLLEEKFQNIVRSSLERVRRSYCIVEPFLFDASAAGVPTNRRRVIIVGYNSDKIGTLTETDFAASSSPYVTVRDAIGDLPPPGNSSSEDFGWRFLNHNKQDATLSDYAKSLREPLPDRIGWCVAVKEFARGSVSGFHPTAHTRAVVKRFSKVRPGAIEPISRYPRLEWNGRCPTLRAGTGVERGSFQAARPIHPAQARVITVREAARLQGFPDAFVFHRTKWHSFRMIGNSVSPPVARRVLEAIRRKILNP